MLIMTCALVTMLSAGPSPWLFAGPPAPAGWRWPLSPAPQVVRDYAPPPRPWLSGHRGVDLAARPGQPVYAAGAGRVSYAGRVAGRGVVALLHGALRTSYLPVRPAVRPGQPVTAGQRLGIVEDVRGHCGPVLCLHWGLRRGRVYLDPLSLLGRGQIRLLPVWASPGLPPPPLGTAARSHPAGRAPTRTSGVVRVGSAPVGRHGVVLTSATAAGGGAVAGALLAYGLILTWRRIPPRRRLPPGVIDFARERDRRR
ncbi:MAG TPA: M23 family metallopeptidase [Streptosporangiaceae bacterium]